MNFEETQWDADSPKGNNNLSRGHWEHKCGNIAFKTN